MHAGHRVLRDGKLARVESIQLRCLGASFGRGLVLGLLFMLIVARLWIPLFELLPPRLGLALGIMPLLVPGLGIGTLADRYGLKASWLWIMAGMLVPLIFEDRAPSFRRVPPESGHGMNFTARSTKAQTCGCSASRSFWRNDFVIFGTRPS